MAAPFQMEAKSKNAHVSRFQFTPKIHTWWKPTQSPPLQFASQPKCSFSKLNPTIQIPSQSLKIDINLLHSCHFWSKTCWLVSWTFKERGLWEQTSLIFVCLCGSCFLKAVFGSIPFFPACRDIHMVPHWMCRHLHYHSTICALNLFVIFTIAALRQILCQIFHCCICNNIIGELYPVAWQT